MDWNDDALAALKKDVPFFVRPAVRRRVESMAAEESRQSIDLSFYQQAKASMGPKWISAGTMRGSCLVAMCPKRCGEVR